MSYSSNANRSELTETGLLAPDSCVVVFAKRCQVTRPSTWIPQDKAIRASQLPILPRVTRRERALHFGCSRAITGVRAKVQGNFRRVEMRKRHATWLRRVVGCAWRK